MIGLDYLSQSVIMARLTLQLGCDAACADALYQGSCSTQLMSAICPFPKHAVKEDATEWLLSASLPFHIRLVWEGASGLVLSLMRLSSIGLAGGVVSDKLLSVMRSCLEGLVKEGASQCPYQVSLSLKGPRSARSPKIRQTK